MNSQGQSKRISDATRMSSIWGVLLVAAFVASCAGDSANKKDDEPSGTASSNRDKSDDSAEPATVRKGVVSLSNNPLTLHALDRGKAEELGNRLVDSAKTGGANEKRSLRGALSAQRLGGVPLERMIETAKRLVEIEMKQGVERELGLEAKLELAYGALRSKRFAFADMMFEDIRASKAPVPSARIKASALVGQGLLAMAEERLPEAAVLWNQALKEVNDFEAARFNIGFLSLKYGDYKTAGKMLSGIDDLFASYGMITVLRLTGDTKGAEKLCEKVLDAKPGFKPALLNCGLVEYQGNQNYARAKQLLTRVVKSQGGDPKYDEEAYRLIAAIEAEEAQAKRPKEAAAAPGKESKDSKDEGSAEKSGK